MAGTGTGYPNWFHCPVKRREMYDHHYRPHSTPTPGRHRVTLTGRTRAAPSPTKGHPRKSRLSREYRCECGHVGWSCHIELEQMEARHD